MAKTKLITAADIRAAMLKKWAAPEWATMWEVNNGTGINGGRRYADAIMMSLWPSRGLELHGVEIKVRKSDWKREAADPTKAELIAAYCDRWWIHTPPGIVDLTELPPAWGLREWSGRQWKTIKEAERTEARPMDRAFLAALLRRNDEAQKKHARDMLEVERARMEQQFRDRVETRIRQANRDHESLKCAVNTFAAQTGLDIRQSSWGGWDFEAVAPVINALKGRDLAWVQSTLEGTHRQLTDLCGRMETAKKALDELKGKTDET
jgi:hypothetical protein